MRNARTVFCIILVIILSSACSTPPKAPDKRPVKALEPKGQRELRAAEASVKSGDAGAADTKLKKFISAHPDAAESARAKYSLGQLHESQQRYAEALTHYLSVANLEVTDTLEADAAIRAAAMQVKLGRGDEAERSLERVTKSSVVLSATQTAMIEETRYELLLQRHDKVAALETLAALAETHPNPQAQSRYKQKLINSVDSGFSLDELKTVSSSKRFGAAQAYAGLRRGPRRTRPRDALRSRARHNHPRLARRRRRRPLHLSRHWRRQP